jgi:hypothetical protein
MAFTLTRLEELAAWCDASSELSGDRRAARNLFFGEDDPAPVKYWGGAEDVLAKRRRFLGWFMFSHSLPDGRKPAERAAERLLRGGELEEALNAIRSERYVLAVITGRIPGQRLYLQLEDENFELRSKSLSRHLGPPRALVSHIVPSRPGVWLPGPGWVEWPVVIGPNMRGELKRYQLDPIQMERMLQGRAAGDQPSKQLEYPRDATLEKAVVRMTEAAKAAGQSKLVMEPGQWANLVLKHLNSRDITSFSQELVNRLSAVKDVDELNRWLGLATNIWNNTPQPDRGGKTALQLASESPGDDYIQERWRGTVGGQ